MIVPDAALRERARLRPENARAAMQQTWAELCFLHWKGDPEVWKKTLPDGLHLDTWDGAAWIGVVPFQMRRIRPAGFVALPWISYFLELNVRTYVHDDHGNPGVWFYSLDTNRWPAYKFARTVFKLPYHHSVMSTSRSGDGWIDYHCRRRGHGGTANFRYRPSAETPRPSAPETFEFFLLERYLLFSHVPATHRFYSGQVHHRPYHYHPVEVETWSTLPVAWDGLPPLEGPPDHACVAEAVDVEVFALNPL